MVCILGIGSCGSSSRSTINIVNNVLEVDKNTITVSNDQINKLIVDTIVNSAQNCSGTAISNQDIILSGVTAEGDFGGIFTQDSTVNLDFKCVNANDVKDSVSTDMINDLMTDLQSNTNQEVLAKMSAAANAQSDSGFLSILSAPSNSKSNVKMQNNYNILKDYQRNIVNSVSNILQKNFTTNIVSNCIATAIANQKVIISNIKTNGNFTPTINQTIAVSLITNCLNQNGVSNKITQELINTFGIKAIDTTSQSSQIDEKASTNATSKSSGVEDLFNSQACIYILIMIGVLGLCVLIVIGINAYVNTFPKGESRPGSRSLAEPKFTDSA